MLCLSLVRVSLCNSGRHLIAPQGIESLKMNVLCIVLEKAVKKVGSNILIQCMKYTQCTEEITPFLFSTLRIPFSLFWHRLEHSTNFVSPLKLARAAWWCWTLSGLCCCSSRSRVIQKNTSGRRGSYLQAFAYILLFCSNVSRCNLYFGWYWPSPSIITVFSFFTFSFLSPLLYGQHNWLLGSGSCG